MNIKDEYGQYRFSEPEKRRHGLDMNCKIIPKQKQNLMAEAPWLALNFGSSGHWEAARVTNQPFKFSKKRKKIQSFKRPALHCIGQWREWPTGLNLDFNLEKKVGSNIVENLANICKLARFINFCAIVFSFCKTGVRQMPQRHFFKRIWRSKQKGYQFEICLKSAQSWSKTYRDQDSGLNSLDSGAPTIDSFPNVSQVFFLPFLSHKSWNV